jgi:hypothetical protein
VGEDEPLTKPEPADEFYQRSLMGTAVDGRLSATVLAR